MPVSAATLEIAIKRAIPVAHLEIRDDSDGCGDKYTVLIVSEVRQFSISIEFLGFSYRHFEDLRRENYAGKAPSR